MKKFRLEILTPEKIVYRGDVEYLNIPAFLGSMGVLAGHMDYLAELEPGKITAVADGTPMLFAISTGFAEIHRDRALVLCETAESAEEIDLERARLEKEIASRSIKTGDAAASQARMSFLKALARIKVAGELGKLKKTKRPV
jgi:F-type H+-transporting ATPase subunit epsilon